MGHWEQDSVGTKTSYSASAAAGILTITQEGLVTPADGAGVLQLTAHTLLVINVPDVFYAEVEFYSDPNYPELVCRLTLVEACMPWSPKGGGKRTNQHHRQAGEYVKTQDMQGFIHTGQLHVKGWNHARRQAQCHRCACELQWVKAANQIQADQDGWQ